MIRKTLVTVALTAGMVAGSAGVASAHECFVAKRSAQGNVSATNSANWHTLPASALYAGVHEFLQERDPGKAYPALGPDQVALAMQLGAEAGVPSTFTVFGKHTIPVGRDAWSPKAGDGKGIDSFVAAHGDAIIGIYLSLAFPPAQPV